MLFKASVYLICTDTDINIFMIWSYRISVLLILPQIIITQIRTLSHISAHLVILTLIRTSGSCVLHLRKKNWIIWIKLECGTNFTKDELSLTWSLMSMRHVGKFHVSKDCESEYIVIYFVFGLFIHVLINCFFVVVLMICFNYFCFFFIFSFSSSSTSFFSFIFSSSCSLYVFFSPFTFHLLFCFKFLLSFTLKKTSNV